MNEISFLTKKLTHHLGQARLWLGERQKLPLLGGLVIEITQERSGMIWLALSREGVEPSQVECRTVLDYWPEPLPEPRPIFVGRKEGRIYFRTVRWPRVALLAAPARAAAPGR